MFDNCSWGVGRRSDPAGGVGFFWVKRSEQCLPAVAVKLGGSGRYLGRCCAVFGETESLHVRCAEDRCIVFGVCAVGDAELVSGCCVVRC